MKAPTVPDELAAFIQASVKNVGLKNETLADFVRFLIQGLPIIAAYGTAQTAPGSERNSLDLMVLTAPALISVTAFPSGRVVWSLTRVRECIYVSAEIVGNLVVGTISVGSALSLRIADLLDQEGELNEFLVAVSKASRS
ncbi:MAG TPA: hypothetical protein VMG81_03260 [Thermoplasmata archaeon]|nr:hypothetical protein [Thermoplasmata archaeon]